jgi:hypothetical protein
LCQKWHTIPFPQGHYCSEEPTGRDNGFIRSYKNLLIEFISPIFPSECKRPPTRSQKTTHHFPPLSYAGVWSGRIDRHFLLVKERKAQIVSFLTFFVSWEMTIVLNFFKLLIYEEIFFGGLGRRIAGGAGDDNQKRG